MHLSNLVEPNMPSTVSKEMDPLLARAIQDAPKTRLIWLLNQLLQSNDHAADLAQMLMLTNENGAVKKRRSDEDIAPAAKKRKRYEMCGQCGDEFDILANTKQSCLWHPGKKASFDKSKRSFCC